MEIMKNHFYSKHLNLLLFYENYQNIHEHTYKTLIIS